MRTAAVLLFALLLACAAGPGAVRAQTAPVADTPAPDPLAALPVPLRDQFAAALEKATAAERTALGQKMKAATVALVKAAGLTSDVPLKDLAAAARAATDRSLAEWTEATGQRAAADYRQDPELAEWTIAALAKAKGSSLLQDDGSLAFTPPDEQPAWTEAVRKVLTPEQLAAWQAKAAEDKKEDQETAKFLDAQTDKAREQCEPVIHAQIAEWTDALGLSADRVSRLEALGRRAIEQTLALSRAVAARTLRNNTAAGRQRMEANSQYFLNVRGDFAPTKQEIWTSGLARLLTDADRQRLAALQEEHETQRADALGRILLVLMDEQAALTSTQRDRLRGPAQEAVKHVKTLFPSGDSQSYYQFARESFFEAATHLPEETARAVLDPVQWQHWQGASKDSAEGRNPPPPARGIRRRGAVQDDSQTKEPLVPVNAEPEAMENFLSDAFEEKAAEERRRELAVLLLKTEDATRVAGLNPAVTARLQTAARGTVEEALAAWKANVAQNIRAQMENSDPENFRNLLANISNMQFGVNEPDPGAENRSLWEKTVDRELSAAQRAAWQREVDARLAYKEQAVAALVLAEFDRRYELSSAQRGKLEPLLLTIIRDYSPEIRRMFAYSSANTPWYFQSYTMFLPLMGIPADSLKAVIGQERWDQWNSSQEHANGANYWQSVQQFHDAKLTGSNK